MDLITRLLESPYGKKIEKEGEQERLAGRLKCRERIDEAERKYAALTKQVDPKIEAAQRAITEFRRKFEAAREEANRLASEKRIAYINRDNLVSTQQGLLRQTVHPNVPLAIDACWKKLNELKGESGERKSKPNIWGVVTHAFWSNARSVDARKTIIRKVLEKLQGMELEAIEDEAGQVAKFMNEIPKDSLQSDYSEASYEPEAMRLKRYPARLARGG